MVRSFQDTPVPAELLDQVLASGLRAPSAGYTQGADLVVLEGPDQTAKFWAATATAEWRHGADRREGLLRAPVVILPMSNRPAYQRRYSEPDKAGLGADWSVPYWTVDAAFSAMLILLRAVDLGLGALFFRIFSGEEALMLDLGVPEDVRPIGAIALGYPAPDRPSPSLARRRRPLEEMVHRGRW